MVTSGVWARERLRLLGREFGPVLGIGRRALRRHPVWTTETAEGSGLGVVVVPGFGGADASMAVLRSWLNGRGYAAVGAGLGLNLGCTAELAKRLEHRVEDHARATGGPVVLVGHSRGGWLGRLVAVRRPELVVGVVMLGSPVLDPLDAHGVAQVVLRVLLGVSRIGVRGVLNDACLHGTCREATVEGLTAPLRPPALAVYSRDDGVVGWRSCRDPEAEWIEVSSSHTGMGIDPELYAVLAPWLANWAADHGDVAIDRDAHPTG